jgi:putative ABC transport system permease protein
LRLVVREGMDVTLIGIAIGVGAALALSRLIQALLFGVTPTDPATYAAVTLALLLVAAVASYLPARRASHVDPIVALRCD